MHILEGTGDLRIQVSDLRMTRDAASTGSLAHFWYVDRVVMQAVELFDSQADECAALNLRASEFHLDELDVHDNVGVDKGAVCVLANGSASITDSTFVGNVSDGLGGALFGAAQSGILLAIGNTLRGNQADRGGGWYSSSGFPGGVTDIIANTFDSNVAQRGGGLCLGRGDFGVDQQHLRRQRGGVGRRRPGAGHDWRRALADLLGLLPQHLRWQTSRPTQAVGCTCPSSS